MGPKPASSLDKLQFILQCLHSITDGSGNPATPDYNKLGELLNIKSNSVYVKYRDIVNKEIENGVKGLHPVGKKANAARSAGVSTTAISYGQVPAASTRVPTSSDGKKKMAAIKRKNPHSNDNNEEVEDNSELAKRQKTGNEDFHYMLPFGTTTTKEEERTERSSDLDAEGDFDDF